MPWRRRAVLVIVAAFDAFQVSRKSGVVLVFLFVFAFLAFVVFQFLIGRRQELLEFFVVDVVVNVVVVVVVYLGSPISHKKLLVLKTHQ